MQKLSAGKDEKESAKVVTNGHIAQTKNLENTQDIPVGTDPVLIIPASPVSVVSSVQVRFQVLLCKSARISSISTTKARSYLGRNGENFFRLQKRCENHQFLIFKNLVFLNYF